LEIRKAIYLKYARMMLNNKRVLVAGVTNVVTINTEEYDLELPYDSITFVLLVNVLHEIDDRKRFIGEIKRIFKPDGRLAVVEWKKENIEIGPSAGHQSDLMKRSD